MIHDKNSLQVSKPQCIKHSFQIKYHTKKNLRLLNYYLSINYPLIEWTVIKKESLRN